MIQSYIWRSNRHPSCQAMSTTILTSLLTLTLLPTAAVHAEEEFNPIDQIIVTARKRMEMIQDVPFAINAVTGTQIERRDMRGLADITQITPGFTFDGFSTSGLTANVGIRGMANSLVTSRTSNTAVFLNGMYLQRQSMIDPGLMDIERVEILKGAQSSLFGRNAFAGAVSYITSEPSDQFTVKLNTTRGDSDREDYRFRITGPIWGDKLFGKISAGVSEYDGHTSNYHPAADANPSGENNRGNLGGWDDQTISAGLRFQPNDSMEFALDYYKSEQNHETQPSFTLQGAAAVQFGLEESPGDLNCSPINIGRFTADWVSAMWCGTLPTPDKGSIMIDPRGFGAEMESEVISLKFTWEALDNLNVSYVIGYTDHLATTNGSDGGDSSVNGSALPIDGFPIAIQYVDTAIFSGRPNNELDSITHEMRAEWEFSDELTFSFGYFYSDIDDASWVKQFNAPPCSDLDDEDCRTSLNQTNNTLEGINPFDFLGEKIYGNFYLSHGIRTGYEKFNDEVQSVFGDIGWQVNDDVVLRFELRYSQEDKSTERVNDQSGLAFGETLVIEDPNGGDDFVIESGITKAEDSTSFDFIAPRFALEWQLQQGRLFYATVSKGVKTGGFTNAKLASQREFDEEVNLTHEVGLKSMFFQDSLLLNVALYYVDWKDIQGSIPQAVDTTALLPTIVGNTGDATVKGLEIDFAWRMNQTLTLTAGLALTNPEYDGGVYAAAVSNFGCPDPNVKEGDADFDDTVLPVSESVCPRGADIDGNQIVRTSKRQMFINANFNFLLFERYRTSLDLHHYSQSAQYLDQLNLSKNDPRRLLNVYMNTQFHKNFDVTLWCKNLMDKEYVESANVIGAVNLYAGSLAPRRTAGFTLNYHYE